MTKAALLPVLLGVVLSACRMVAPAAPKSAATFYFPKVNPAHTHMRRLLANALGYTAPANALTDPTSGYPFEGWNQDPAKGLYFRSFTQLTAIWRP